MTFPQTPLAQTVELELGGTWTDITSLVYGREPLTVTRGRSDEGTKVDRSTCKATVNNRSGNLSPRNPTGIYYGQLGRNTPMRVRLSPATPKYLLLAGDTDTAVTLPLLSTELSTDDTAGLSITGDIDIRIDFKADAYGFRGAGLCNKYNQTGDQRSWSFWLNADRTLTFTWSTDGTAGTLVTATSTAAVTVPASGRLAARVTLDVVNGANKTVTFYTASTIADSFSQLGSAVTTAGNTSIFNSTAQVELGRSHTTNSDGDLRGRVYAFEMYASLNGTSIRADVDINTDADAGDASFVGSDGATWTLSGDTSIVDPAIRFRGEVASWPQRWDSSGRDVYTQIEAAGILRRLGQGSSPLKSTLYRGYTSAAFTPVAYWPCEDGQDSTVIASALTGGRPMRRTLADSTATVPDFAASSSFKCSAPLPTMAQVEMTGTIPTYTASGSTQLFFLMQVPAAGVTNGQGLIDIQMTGTARRWVIVYGTGGTLDLRAQDADGTNLATTGAVAFNVNGKLLRVDLELVQNGADIDYDLATLEVGAAFGNVTSGTLTTDTIGRATKVVVDPGANLDGVVFGHISVHNEIRSLFDLWQELNAYAGETAGRRIQRLCGEEQVAFRVQGDPDASAAMGPQTVASLLDLLRECEDADGGVLYEPRDLFGITYRPLLALGAQTATLELDYTAKHLSLIDPTDDDQHVRNDVTVRRNDGSSARVVLEAGPLSVAAPPAGVGRYDEEVSLNLATDELLEDAAGWRVHLGTVDEARYPELELELARSVFTTGGSLALAVQDLDVGDRLTIDNPPAWLPPELIDQLAQGFKEVLAGFTHTFTVNCSPGTPWTQVGVWSQAADRYTSDGSTLAEDLTTGETAVDVATPAGPLWSHADGDFDLMVGGEQMTVTAVSGASSPQTFTVTRSVNGVVKTHATGAAVELFHLSVYAP